MFIYHYLFTLVLKSPNGEWPIRYTYIHTIIIIIIVIIKTFRQRLDTYVGSFLVIHPQTCG